MTKRKTGTCQDCGRYAGRENLSNKNLCYECAKKRMVEFFDGFWKANHPVRVRV